MDVYKIVDNLLEEHLPRCHRYILSELDESRCVQIRTTNWTTHNMVQDVLKYRKRLNNTYSEGWCEGTSDHGLEHGDIQVIEVRQIRERK